MFRVTSAKLHDCDQHGLGSDSELFVVEGDSASKNVVRVRDSRFQAVLPMQGKPMNAWKSSKNGVGRNELYQRLIDAMGAGWDESFDLQRLRYERIVLLFDPDADGIHCGALMLMFFHRWMPELLETGRIHVIRPPLYELSAPQTSSNQSDDHIHAYSDDHFHQLRDHLNDKQIKFQSQRYRGLASINAGSLKETCIDPATRSGSLMSHQDAEAAIRIFGGQRS